MEHLICTECRGSKVIKLSQTEFECEYCGAIIKDTTIQLIQPSVDEEPLNDSLFPPVVEYAATHKEGVTAQNGKISIMPDTFTFYPNTSQFNTGNITPRKWNITDIKGYTKGTFNFLDITMRDGSKIHLALTDKDQFIGLLEERRKYWTIENNTEVHPSVDVKVSSSAGRISFPIIIIIIVIITILGWILIISNIFG